MAWTSATPGDPSENDEDHLTDHALINDNLDEIKTKIDAIGPGTAGANGGLTLAGTAFSILLDTNSGLVLGAGGIKLDTTQFANLGISRKYAVDVPNGSTTATITHNLGTVDVHVQIIDKASGVVLLHEESSRTINTVVLVFAVAPTSGQYRAIVVG